MENQSRINDLLVSALDDLSQEDFKRFKDKLSHSAFEVKRRIPVGRLEKADKIDTKNLLMGFYPGAAAVNVTIEVFTHINRRDSAAKLREESQKALSSQQTPETSANAYRVKYREHIKNKYRRIEDRNARLGENVKLNSRYTKLIIVNEHRHKKQREHEITASGRRHAEIMSKQASPITISDLFKSDGKEPSPQVIVLQGAAGIGKTLTSRKIMLDWANRELYQSKFDYAFYINCREINFVREQGSIEDLILKNCPDQNAPIKEILMTPEKLLFIIDGFDELRFSFNCSETNFSSDPNKKQPMEITLCSLLRKKVLRQSHLLITTRPTALETLKQCLEKEHYMYAEILGFSEKERKEYFDKFFGNKTQAQKAFNFVKNNEMLFTMCFIPMACWIICTVLKQQMEAGEDPAQTSTTLTDVYMFFLFSLLKHHRSPKQELQDNIKGLCSLAADGLWRQKILFEEEDVKKHGLDKPDSLFLNENMFQKAIDCECLYSFIHLSFQEFFAALFYVLEKEEKEKISENAIRPVEILFEEWKKSRSYLMFTMRFLFGLLNKERLKNMEKELSCKISPKIQNNLTTLIKEKLFLSLVRRNETSSAEKTVFYLEYFHCLYEIQETGFVQDSLNHLTELTLVHHTFTKMDQIALSFCIKNCSILESLEINFCRFLTEDLNEDSAEPQKQSDGAEPQHEPCHSPIYLLCQALKAPNCKLKKLKLYSYLTQTCCGDLADVLRDSQTLTELDLFRNLGNPGMQLLCKGLKHPNCKLQRLCLDDCNLTGACCGDLADVLRASQSLTELNLKRSKLDDAEVQLLCKGLIHSSCKLQRLNLENCSLRGTCCGDLADVLRARQSLTDLNLFNNYLGDAGVKLLIKGLKHQNCKLQRLRLDYCAFTDSCCEDLAAVLRTNQSLIELDLSGNNLGDHGMQLVCEGLKENSKLQSLKLAHCRLTASCCKALAAALRMNESLTELDLSVNAFGNRSMQLLCEGLKQNRKLQSLNLYNSYESHCSVTAAGCGDLAALLKTSQSLRKLDLGNHYLGDAGVRLLCEVMKDPNCKLETLGLKECGLTDACCGDLSTVLSTSQTLTYLDILGIILEDSGVQQLCEGLKHPNCKLQTLRVEYSDLTPEMQAELDAVKEIRPDFNIKDCSKED